MGSKFLKVASIITHPKKGSTLIAMAFLRLWLHNFNYGIFSNNCWHWSSELLNQKKKRVMIVNYIPGVASTICTLAKLYCIRIKSVMHNFDNFSNAIIAHSKIKIWHILQDVTYIIEIQNEIKQLNLTQHNTFDV